MGEGGATFNENLFICVHTNYLNIRVRAHMHARTEQWQRRGCFHSEYVYIYIYIYIYITKYVHIYIYRHIICIQGCTYTQTNKNQAWERRPRVPRTPVGRSLPPSPSARWLRASSCQGLRPSVGIGRRRRAQCAPTSRTERTTDARPAGSAAARSNTCGRRRHHRRPPPPPPSVGRREAAFGFTGGSREAIGAIWRGALYWTAWKELVLR